MDLWYKNMGYKVPSPISPVVDLLGSIAKSESGVIWTQTVVCRSCAGHWDVVLTSGKDIVILCTWCGHSSLIYVTLPC